ncbi:hypothetical protein N7532_010783 [Penicillium argentinense]|uniref:FCP1 homology domain-containing protein n=1 Tax=Penicillium argentinense TaxID=1131581 RepID=A0A9W9JYW3_9EURO|nr:uncharacterized protein N7532_010783 [Penicillium argentinense]KAJ5086012.1 hypothetical protein N7532_010783 [Penicillium argentinense]
MPKKHHLLIPMPSRRSSKAEKQSTSEKTDEVTVNDPSRRSSKVSILKGKRDRSRASSRRSRRTQEAVTAEKSNEATTPTTPEMNDPSKPTQKKTSRFLAFLCCSSPDADGDDSALPPKKSTKLPPTSNRLPTPDKTEAHTGDSSTAESRDPAYFADEKAQPIVSSENSQPKAEEHASHAPEDAQTEGASAAAGKSEANPANAKEEETTSTTENGVVSEPKTHGAEPPIQDKQTVGDEAPPAVADDASAKQPLSSDADDSVHEEEVPPTTVLPPPPPLPVPEAPSAPDADDQRWLLPPPLPHLQNRKCLVLDLDETLVHSSFKVRNPNHHERQVGCVQGNLPLIQVLERADFTIPVEIEGQYHNIYVIKRPGVDQFMKRVGELYEVVVFTASVSKYGDPLLDQLDIHNVVHHRLFRESCYNHQGNYVKVCSFNLLEMVMAIANSEKDLSQVGRDLRETIIIDNSPTSYIFHPQHAIPISSWFSDAHDNELLDLIPVLEDLAGQQVQDVSMVLDITL